MELWFGVSNFTAYLNTKKMKIDFDHWKGSQIGDEIFNQLDLERRLSIISALKPKFIKEGDKWCYLYGEVPNDCIVGFGDTPHDAMNDFVYNFNNQKATKA